MFHVKHRLSFPERSPACTRLRTASVDPGPNPQTDRRVHRRRERRAHASNAWHAPQPDKWCYSPWDARTRPTHARPTPPADRNGSQHDRLAAVPCV